MPGYFSHVIERPTHSETLEASLVALKDELSPDVYRDHVQRVRSEVERLTSALSQIARGFPCTTQEAMQRFASRAIPEDRR